MVQSSKVLSARIVLVLPSEQLTLNTYTITKIEFNVTSPQTDSEIVTMNLSTRDSGISLTLSYNIEGGKYSVHSFQEYLSSLGITKSASTFNMHDVIITLVQSDMRGYSYLSSLSQNIVGVLLDWNINEQDSKIEFSSFPIGPVVVTNADIVTQIPPSSASVVDLGRDSIML